MRSLSTVLNTFSSYLHTAFLPSFYISFFLQQHLQETVDSDSPNDQPGNQGVLFSGFLSFVDIFIHSSIHSKWSCFAFFLFSFKAFLSISSILSHIQPVLTKTHGSGWCYRRHSQKLARSMSVCVWVPQIPGMEWSEHLQRRAHVRGVGGMGSENLYETGVRKRKRDWQWDRQINRKKQKRQRHIDRETATQTHTETKRQRRQKKPKDRQSKAEERGGGLAAYSRHSPESCFPPNLLDWWPCLSQGKVSQPWLCSSINSLLLMPRKSRFSCKCRQRSKWLEFTLTKGLNENDWKVQNVPLTFTLLHLLENHEECVTGQILITNPTLQFFSL